MQVIPHVTNEIKDRINRLAEQTQPDVILTEVGGTVGDIESLPFLEAIRQLQEGQGPRERLLHPRDARAVDRRVERAEDQAHPALGQGAALASVSSPTSSSAARTAPSTSASAARSALFCDVDPEAVVSAIDARSIYEVPRNLAAQGLDEMVIERLQLECGEPDMTEWDAFVAHSASLADEVNIALVGKYVQLPDAYLSVNEALDHAGIFHDHKVNVHWVDAESLTPEEVDQILAKMDGILVPGGFGIRGIEGKIRAACYARENLVPYFGICLGHAGRGRRVRAPRRRACRAPTPPSSTRSPSTPSST